MRWHQIYLALRNIGHEKKWPHNQLIITNCTERLSASITTVFLLGNYNNVLVATCTRQYAVFLWQQSPGNLWWRLSCDAWENDLEHFSQTKGFCPVCVLIWLFSVVEPANERPQKPHLNGLSLLCVTTCVRNSVGWEKDWEQCPHWYGFSGKRGHTWICSNERWVKLLKHWPHLQTPDSRIPVSSRGLLRPLPASCLSAVFFVTPDIFARSTLYLFLGDSVEILLFGGVFPGKPVSQCRGCVGGTRNDGW